MPIYGGDDRNAPFRLPNQGSERRIWFHDRSSFPLSIKAKPAPSARRRVGEGRLSP